MRLGIKLDKTEIISAAESLLPPDWGEGVLLHVDQTYENANTVVMRSGLANHTESAPSRVAIKHVRAYDENRTDYLHSFLNDWAACIFLNSFKHDPPLAPRFYCGDIERRIIVMEDLGDGDGPNTMALLEGGDPAMAEQGLVEHTALIGQLHGATVGWADNYLKLREALGPHTPDAELYTYPWSNARRKTPAASEINRAIERYRSVRGRLGLPSQSGADAEIEVISLKVESDPGPFLAYCKGDQNLAADFIRSDGRLRLFDYGEGGYRHALLEGMPGRFTWGCMMRIPDHLVPKMEASYRRELVKGCADAVDDAVWRRAMADAGARWHIFHVLARIPTAMDHDYQRGPTTLRQQVTAWIGAFSDLAEETGFYTSLGRSAREISSRLRAIWRAEETSLPYYPAFSLLT